MTTRRISTLALANLALAMVAGLLAMYGPAAVDPARAQLAWACGGSGVVGLFLAWRGW